MNERETKGDGERETYSIHIRRKLLCCHQPLGGKHSKLVCAAASGYNCLDVNIVSMDRVRSEKGRKVVAGRGSKGVHVKYGFRKLAWRSPSARVKVAQRQGEKIVYEAFHPRI